MAQQQTGRRKTGSRRLATPNRRISASQRRHWQARSPGTTPRRQHEALKQSGSRQTGATQRLPTFAVEKPEVKPGALPRPARHTLPQPRRPHHHTNTRDKRQEDTAGTGMLRQTPPPIRPHSRWTVMQTADHGLAGWADPAIRHPAAIQSQQTQPGP